MITQVCPRCRIEYQSARHRAVCPACWYEYDREQKMQYYRKKQRELGREVKEIGTARRRYTRTETFVVISSPYPEYEGRVYTASKMHMLLATDGVPIGMRVISVGGKGPVYEVVPEGETDLMLRIVI